MSKLAFTKMHGLGNDFVVVNNLQGDLQLEQMWIRTLSDRHTGVGFDQLLVVEQATTDDVEFNYRIFNADGHEVEHCGNGARCFARFVRDKRLTESTTIPVNTSGGRIELMVLDDGRVTVAMGVPNFDPALIPLNTDSAASARTDSSGIGFYSLTLPDDVPGLDETGISQMTDFDSASGHLAFYSTSIGNPHAVIRVADVAAAPVEALGAWLESHTAFPQRVNVGFLQIEAPDKALLRVFERGVGETRACGTGACAAVAVAGKNGLLERNATVTLPGGSLDISWPNDERDIEMTGPCTTVFEGLIEM